MSAPGPVPAWQEWAVLAGVVVVATIVLALALGPW